jgi:hypothetical protein
MDKMFFLSHRTTLALEKSEEFLNNRNLFGSLRSDSNLLKRVALFWGREVTLLMKRMLCMKMPPPILRSKAIMMRKALRKMPQPN